MLFVKLRKSPLFLCCKFLSWMDIESCEMPFLLWWIWSHDLSSSCLLIWSIITLIDFQILKHPCIPGISPSLSYCIVLFIYYWIPFANSLLRIYASLCIGDTGLMFSPFLWSLVWYQGDSSFIQWIGKYFLLFCLLEEIV